MCMLRTRIFILVLLRNVENVWQLHLIRFHPQYYPYSILRNQLFQSLWTSIDIFTSIPVLPFWTFSFHIPDTENWNVTLHYINSVRLVSSMEKLYIKYETIRTMQPLLVDMTSVILVPQDWIILSYIFGFPYTLKIV